jgi:multidrug efflux pump subunit AcrA (membrane-fusion protein)
VSSVFPKILQKTYTKRKRKESISMSKNSNILVRRKKLFIVIAIIIVLVGAGFIINSLRGDKEAAGSAETATMKLARIDLEQIVTATGTVQSVDNRAVSAPATMSAPVSSVSAKVGQHVDKGETLCTFDTQMLDINIAAAKKSLSSANAQSNAGLKQARRRVADAQKQYNDDKKRLDKEVSKAKKQLDNAKKKPATGSQDTASSGAGSTGLPGAGVGAGAAGAAGATGAATAAATSAASYKTAYETAKSTRDQTLRADKAQITSAKDALETQQLMDSAEQIQSQLDVYEQQKKDAVIKSPITGTVTTANAKAGSYPGMEGPLFVIEDIDRLEVTALVPEYDASILEDGLSVDIISDAIQGGSWRGEIASISPVATDAAGNFTATISVTTELGGLKSGMSAKLNIVTDSRQNVFAVPYGALGENAEGASVIYVIDAADTAGTDDTGAAAAAGTAQAGSGSGAKSVEPREIVVTTGLETDYYVEISGDQLTEGLDVLTDPDGLNTDAPAALPDPETMAPGATE